ITAGDSISAPNFFGGWFYGLFNWTVNSIYASFDGATLIIDDDLLNSNFNQTQTILDNNDNWTTTYNATYNTWAYNQTQAVYDNPLGAWLSTYNATYDLWAYNQTTATFTLYNDIWSSTYNATYEGSVNNASYLSTYNATYDAKVSFPGYDNIALTNISNTFDEDQTFSKNITAQGIKLASDTSNHQIYDNSTCVIITGDTSTLYIC
ncbi:unnamed protein product, partial [marine sediment metagenome]